jgi:nucleoside-diphosphate-sugar epimerase
MDVLVAGGHGQIARRLLRLLAQRGHTARGLIRNPDHVADLESDGAHPILCDLEHDDVRQFIGGADAIVFAAGAGPGSGAERKLSMDRDGAVKLLDATAERATPYVIVSSVGAENPPPDEDDDVFSVYLRAKAGADAAVQASDRDWTIVRPGRLTDDPGSGRVRIDTMPFRGDVPREDVAEVLAAVLHQPRANRRVLYVNGGEDAVEDVLTRVLAG